MAVRSRASGEGTQGAAPRRAASTRKSQGKPQGKPQGKAQGKAQGKSQSSSSATRKTGTTRTKRAGAGAKVSAPLPPAAAEAVRCAERTDDYKVLVFGASCALEEAGALRVALLEALADGTPLVLDGSGIQRIDTAGLQLLVGLSFECMERGIAFGWRDRSEALKDVIALTGVAPLLESPTPVTMPARA